MTRHAFPLGRVLRLAVLLALTSAPAVGCKKGTIDAPTRAPTTAVAEPARARFDRGVALMDEGADKYDDAIAEFDAAIALAPDLWEAHLDIGVIELRRARLSKAAAAFERSLEIYGSPAALAALADVYIRQGRHERAVKLLERALAGSPEDIELRNQLAIALRHAGRLDDAAVELRAVLGRDAADPVAYATLAAVEMDRGDLDIAELVLNRGLVRRPDHPLLLTNLGLVALRRGDDQAAFMLFDKASQADPRFLTGRLNKAAVYLGAGDHAHAATELQYVLKVEPGNTDALLGLGLAQRMAGDLPGAREHWTRVLAIDAENAAALFNLGVLEMDFAERPKEATAHLERYLQVMTARDLQGSPRALEAKERLELIEAIAKG
jgi:tetratricopeptide (TPR) repeat protein